MRDDRAGLVRRRGLGPREGTARFPNPDVLQRAWVRVRWLAPRAPALPRFPMRLVVPFVIALTLAIALAVATAPSAQAQRATGLASAQEAVVVPALPGEAVRITTPRRAPSNRDALRRFRGIRVYRSSPAGVHAIPADAFELAFPTYHAASGETFVRRGGSYFLAAPARPAAE